MSDGGRRQAWADFWTEGHSGEVGCLAGAESELGSIQSALWRDFAVSLPRGARVLDLGTGNGVVLAQMAQARKDLRLTGVDSATSLPRPSGKLRLMAGVAMEDLPFADDSFEAVVSQFGYEYGDTAQSAREVARVIAPEGSFLFLGHRLDGPIVAHNRARAEALLWAIQGSGLFDRARALASARRTLPLPTPPSFRQAVADAAQRFSRGSVATEIAQAVLQSLALPPHDSLAAIREIERKAKAELLRLNALLAAARDEKGAVALAEELRAAGLQSDKPVSVVNRSGQPFAWKLAGRA